MISIYLFVQKNVNLFSSIFKKSYLHLLFQKNLLQNFNLATKKLFLLAFTIKELIFTNYLEYIDSRYLYRKHDFYNFIYKNIKIQSNFINTKKKLSVKKWIFTKLITKMFESLVWF